MTVVSKEPSAQNCTAVTQALIIRKKFNSVWIEQSLWIYYIATICIKAPEFVEESPAGTWHSLQNYYIEISVWLITIACTHHNHLMHLEYFSSLKPPTPIHAHAHRNSTLCFLEFATCTFCKDNPIGIIYSPKSKGYTKSQAGCKLKRLFHQHKSLHIGLQTPSSALTCCWTVWFRVQRRLQSLDLHTISFVLWCSGSRAGVWTICLLTW